MEGIRMKKTFKRSINTKSLIAFFILFALSVILAILSSSIDIASKPILYFELALLALLLSKIAFIANLVILFNDLFFFSDFKITVVKKYDYLIFELSKYDHRIINKHNLKITKKMTSLILSDGNSIMRISYNKDLLNFLMKVSK